VDDNIDLFTKSWVYKYKETTKVAQERIKREEKRKEMKYPRN